MTAAVEALGTRLGPVVTESVDVLHVAAVLESSGITDDLARDRYGHEDVFALATTLRARASDGSTTERPTTPHPGTIPAAAPLRRERPRSASGVSSLGHGVIYLLPALSMPALLTLVGTRHALLALVVGAALGWLWAVVMTWRAYGVLSATASSEQGQEHAAADLRRSVLLGVVAGTLAGLLLVVVGRTPVVVGVVAASVTAAQLGTTLLFFLRRRRALVVVLVVQGTVGLSNLVAPAVVPAWVVLATFVLSIASLLVIGGVGRGPAAPAVALVGLTPVLGYAVASVTFLLLPQAHFLRLGGGLPLALAGLFLTMGFVEWRAGLLSRRLRDELSCSDTPARFRLRASGPVLAEVLACAAVTALGAAAMLLVLQRAGLLSAGVRTVALTTVLLAPAYLLAIVLANTGAYAWLASCFAAGALVETLLSVLARAPMTSAFVTATSLLLLALGAGLLTRPVQHFR
ncbi:hypothetical protein [Ornithinimicrobium sp. LYQ103]|uniref:hypothetical protein n=1 Tax=Ornithinimicrobium sp. LYQ103 TaxID=3378796 RepID=UPI003852C6BB